MFVFVVFFLSLCFRSFDYLWLWVSLPVFVDLVGGQLVMLCPSVLIL